MRSAINSALREWTTVARGLTCVQLAISDPHAALKAAIAKVLGCAWQRCTVHLLRDGLGHARKDSSRR